MKVQIDLDNIAETTTDALVFALEDNLTISREELNKSVKAELEKLPVKIFELIISRQFAHDQVAHIVAQQTPEENK